MMMGASREAKVAEDTREIVLAAIEDALRADPLARKRFLDLWRESAGWDASYRQASQRLAHWLDPENPHRFPVEALPDLIRAVGHARFLDGLLALELRVQRRARAKRVDRRERRGRGAA